jgi:hypothetical protein
VLAAEVGAIASVVKQAARAFDFVIVAIPEKTVAGLPSGSSPIQPKAFHNIGVGA